MSHDSLSNALALSPSSSNIKTLDEWVMYARRVGDLRTLDEWVMYQHLCPVSKLTKGSTLAGDSYTRLLTMWGRRGLHGRTCTAALRQRCCARQTPCGSVCSMSMVGTRWQKQGKQNVRTWQPGLRGAHPHRLKKTRLKVPPALTDAKSALGTTRCDISLSSHCTHWSGS